MMNLGIIIFLLFSQFILFWCYYVTRLLIITDPRCGFSLLLLFVLLSALCGGQIANYAGFDVDGKTSLAIAAIFSFAVWGRLLLRSNKGSH